MIYKVVYKWLREDPEVQRLVGARILPLPAQQDHTKPYIVYEPQTVVHEETLRGHGGLSTATMWVHGVAADPGGLQLSAEIVSAARLALQGRGGLEVAGLTVGGVRTPEESYDYIEPQDEGEYGVHMTSLTVVISWKTPKGYRAEPVEVNQNE